jgi:hypothetical protein
MTDLQRAQELFARTGDMRWWALADELIGKNVSDDSLHCSLCFSQDSVIQEYVALGGPSVCSVCAETIANTWCKKHTGAFLTRANPDRTIYRKEIIPEPLRWEVFERDGFECVKCGSRRMLRADHIVPESKGGKATLGNLQTLCMPCNSSKGSRV